MDQKILNSWKEIASYLGRGIRTVQRWERDFHLPVHRPGGHERSAVIAFPDEVDRWLSATPLRKRWPQAEGRANLRPRTRQLVENVQTNVERLMRSAERLQSSMLRAQEQHRRRQKQSA
jgi:hypothetical protein